MVDVNMNLIPLKIIQKEACVQTKGPSRLSKDPRPEMHPNIIWKRDPKEIKVFMKLEDEGVHHKKHIGSCMKQ
jgi:hypothetical protein